MQAGNDFLGQEFYEIRKEDLTLSTFTVSIQIYGVTNIWILNVAYIAVDPAFPHHLNSFDNVPLNYSNGDIVNITSKSTSKVNYYTNYINYTAQADGRTFRYFTDPLTSNHIVLYISALWIRGTFKSGSNYYPVEFHIYTNVPLQ